MAAEVFGLERSGSADAAVGSDQFAALYLTQFGPLSGYAQALTGDPAAAVDIAQEAFTRLLARWRGVRDTRPWVFFVAPNLPPDYWRGLTRAPALTDPPGPQTALTPREHDPPRAGP